MQAAAHILASHSPTCQQIDRRGRVVADANLRGPRRGAPARPRASGV